MKILTAEDPTRPAATRWVAIEAGWDGALDGNHPFGQGATEDEAIAALEKRIAERIYAPSWTD